MSKTIYMEATVNLLANLGRRNELVAIQNGIVKETKKGVRYVIIKENNHETRK